MNISKYNYIPQFAFKCSGNFMYHRMEIDPFPTKIEAMNKKRELMEDNKITGYRIIKHREKFYLYERK